MLVKIISKNGKSKRKSEMQFFSELENKKKYIYNIINNLNSEWNEKKKKNVKKM